MSAAESARLFQQDLSRVNRQAAGLIVKRWRRVDVGNISGSWLQMLPDATAVVVAAQTVAAELADPYLTRVLADANLPHQAINPAGFAGPVGSSLPADQLVYLPVIDAKGRIAAGVAPSQALRLAEQQLAAYVLTTVADTGRLAVSAGMGARPHATGWYRMLTPPSCSRCAILAGKWFRYNQGFRRHPKCDCVHIPVREADDSLLFDARKAIEAGKVTGLSKADTRAILELGADPSQVVNARRGTFLAGGRSYTTAGTTRHGVAGARILQRDLERAIGGVQAVAGRTFTNMTFSRQQAAEYAALMRKGKTFTRLTKTGRTQSYNYQYTRSFRPTPETILATARSREEALRLLTNNGYILAAPSRVLAAGISRTAVLADRDALNSVLGGLGRSGVSLTRAQRNALRDYQSSYYYAINGQLRRGEVGTLAGRRITNIDAVMAASRLPNDVEVWRGITDASRLFGDRLNGNLTGLVWREAAYVSTSANRARALDFTYPGAARAPVLMRIVVRRGTGAVRLSRYDDQGEILLQRGLRMRVVRDRGVSPDGYRRIDVEVLP